MYSPYLFVSKLKEEGIDFVSGVPDSLLKDFCAILDDSFPNGNHIISANEGCALSLGAGYHLATSKVPLIYLQNSGLGNTVNPLLSLIDPKVYSIPAILLIGWRGEPGVRDEPQHIKQGSITLDLLKTMNIPFFILDSLKVDYTIIKHSIEIAQERQGPVALLAKKGIFESKNSNLNKKILKNADSLITREKALGLIISNFGENCIFVSTTGHISRELYEYRKLNNQSHENDFLTVGSMGHVSQIALGIAIKLKSKKIVCIDGDGSLLMHMGGAATIGQIAPSNFFHILLNNGVHDSVGAQPTAGFDISFPGIIRSCSYKNVVGKIKTEEEIIKNIKFISNKIGPNFVEVIIKPGARKDLGRPKESPDINKKIFMRNISGDY